MARQTFKRRKFCRFTAEKIQEVDYKQVDLLKENHSRSHHWHKSALPTPIGCCCETRSFLGFVALH